MILHTNCRDGTTPDYLIELTWGIKHDTENTGRIELQSTINTTVPEMRVVVFTWHNTHAFAQEEISYGRKPKMYTKLSSLQHCASDDQYLNLKIFPMNTSMEAVAWEVRVRNKLLPVMDSQQQLLKVSCTELNRSIYHSNRKVSFCSTGAYVANHYNQFLIHARPSDDNRSKH
uniref:Uncharacterized protein n=1 Tax=Anopheles atroparvus TaxID=41427 RepID=A0AAG5CR56_ANOAO